MLSDYFKERDGFKRLFLALKAKYQSLSRYAGTVVVKAVCEEEASTLSQFFGRKIVSGSDFKTSFSEIEKIIKQTKYADFTWENLFSSYFNDKIISKKQAAEIEKQEEVTFLNYILGTLKEPYSVFFKGIIEKKDATYQTIIRRYHKKKDAFAKDLQLLFTLLSRLEEVTPTSLPMLASFIGNPHFLDFKNQNSSLFIKLMANFYQEEEPITTEEKIEFLERHKIYIDTLSNYVITYLIGSDNPMLNDFVNQRQPLNLNLKNLEKLSTLDTENKKVYVFENPSMLSALLTLEVPILITSGNPNYAVYQTIEKLINSGNTIYYNGDFDPEGLLIASSLKKKFPSIKLFCYDIADYEQSCSMNRISNSRLKKLQGIKELELQEIKDILQKNKVAGYQEKNIKRIEKFIALDFIN